MTNDPESAQLALLRQVPSRGSVDLREFAWRYLWERATREFSTHPLDRNTGWHRSGLGPKIAPDWWTGPVIVARRENPILFRVDRLGPRIDSEDLSYLPYHDGLHARWDKAADVVRVGEGLAEPEALAGRGGTPCFSQDGKTLALAVPGWSLGSSQDPPEAVRERQKLRSGKEIDVVRLPVARRLTISADGQTAALLTPLPGSDDHAPLIYDLKTGQGRIFPQLGRPAKFSRVNNDGNTIWFDAPLALSADGTRLAIGGWEERLVVLDARDGRALWRKTEADGFKPDAFVEHLAFSSNGERLVGSDSGDDVLLWDAETGERLGEAPFGAYADGVTAAVGFYPDDETIVALAASEERLRSWSFAPKGLAPPGFDHGAEVWGLVFIPGSNLLASSGDNHQIRLWDLDRNGLKATLADHDTLVTAIATSPDGRVLASGDYRGHLRLWDLDALEAPPRRLPSIPRRARAMSWSPDGRWLAVAGDSDHIHVWEREADRWIELEVDYADNRGAYAFGVAWSPDGSVLAAGGHERAISLWRWPDASPMRTIETHAKIGSILFAPDGSALIAGTPEGDLRSWALDRLDEPQVSLERNPRPGGIWGLVLSPDGRTLASGRDDGQVVLWDPETLRQTCRINAHQIKVHALAFSPDGRKLATANFDGKILVHSGLETVGPLQLAPPSSPPSPK